MVLKDKLVKTHHKGIYYKTRKVIIGVICGFTFCAAIVVPTYISTIMKNNHQAGLAEEDTRSSEVVEEKENSEYEEYINE